MTRYVNNTVIQARLEPSYGTLPTPPWLATDAILISDAKFKIQRDNVPRKLLRGYFGGSEELVATRRADIEFDVEFAGSGTAGTAPAWGKLLRACGMAEVITAANRVEYTPITTAFESLTFRFYLDGIYYVARGARGNVSVKMPAYEIPKLHFMFMGFDMVAAEIATPTPDFTAWKRPLVVTDTNAGDIQIGGTYTAGVVSGGTVMKSRGLEFDLGNKVSHLNILGGEAIDITARETTGSASVFLTAADEVIWRNDMNNNALTSIGFNFGTTAGSRVTVFAPQVQRIAPDVEDYEGRVLFNAELRNLPLSGNDELRIVAR
jgi:hypothetical protein